MSHHAHGSLSKNWPNSSIAEDPDSIVYKRSDPDTPMGDVDAEFSLSQVFECPNGDDAEEAQLPEFRYKCKMLLMLMHDARLTITDNCRNAFYDHRAVGSKGQFSRIPGICKNVASFMATRAIAPGTRIELTLDPQKRRTNRRRDSVCTQGFCQSEQKSLIDQIGLPKNTRNLISYDEFPFAGTKEGGQFFGTYAAPQDTNKYKMCASLAADPSGQL